MSNESYNNLHQLVEYLLKNNILSKEEMAKIFKISVLDFTKEFENYEEDDAEIS